MKIARNTIKSVLLAAAMACSIYVYSGNISFHNTVSSNSLNVRAAQFDGTGKLISDKISITCDRFAFTGTIACNGACIIRCKETFDPAMFTKEGTGRITIIIHPYEDKSFSKVALLAAVPNILLVENSTAAAVDKRIQLVRYYAATNHIDEKMVFDAIHRSIDQRMGEYMDQIADIRQKTTSSERVQQIKNYFQKLAGVFNITFGVSEEQYIEKLAMLSMIKERLGIMLKEPFVVPECQVITL